MYDRDVLDIRCTQVDHSSLGPLTRDIFFITKTSRMVTRVDGITTIVSGAY
jgi:hypothetical protein